jgi:hypothetical protein
MPRNRAHRGAHRYIVPMPFSRSLGPLLALAALLAFGAPAARADGDPDAAEPRLDEVVLQSGKHFEGRITSEDAKAVVLSLPSETGCGTMTIPREVIREIHRGTERGPLRPVAGIVDDAWFLLQSGGRIVGTRRLVLRKARPGSEASWILEEHVVHLARGRHVPETRVDRSETVDLAFRPLFLDYREVGDGSPDPVGPRGYTKEVLGPVKDGVWTARSPAGGGSEDGAPTDRTVMVPAGTRGRLGTRQDLLRSRQVGVQTVVFLEASETGLVSARAGYTSIDQPDGRGGRFSEFVWEEGDQRLTWRLDGDGKILSEEVAEGVVALPATQKQIEAAAKDSEPKAVDPLVALSPTAAPTPAETGPVALPEVGITFTPPGAAWKVEKPLATTTDVGWRVVARLSAPLLASDIRVEWDPDAALAAPGAAAAEQRLLERLRTVCADLSVTDDRTPVAGVPGAWRIAVRGTLKGDMVRTIAVVVDRGPARILLLCACAESSWGSGGAALEAFVRSIRVL